MVLFPLVPLKLLSEVGEKWTSLRAEAWPPEDTGQLCLTSVTVINQPASPPLPSGERAWSVWPRPPGDSVRELIGGHGCLALGSTPICQWFLAIKRKQKPNTVYSKQYLKSIG